MGLWPEIKLTADEATLLEIARREHFVVWYHESQRHHLAYWDWCAARKIPYLVVRQGRKYANLEYNADTTGYPYTCELPEAALDRIVTIYRAHWKARDSNASIGCHHFGIWGIPNKSSTRVARLIWDQVRPHLHNVVVAADYWLSEE